MPALYFYPRDRQFWLFHSGALLFVCGITLLSIFFLGDFSGFNIMASVVWALPYTYAVLLLRFIYKQRQWQQKSITALITMIILYSTVAGVLVVASVLLLTLPFFWTILSQSQAHFDTSSFIFRNLIGGSLNTQLFICSWIFVYAYISNSRRTRATEINNLRLQHSLKEAQLTNLANQLNPHFLFNALNNIRFMIHENTAHAENMLIALSDILRYSLASSEHAKVTLSQELDIIGRYISIVSIQMEARLQYSQRVEATLQHYLLPPMMLQMLIENAIKHGVDNIAGGGRLELTAEEHEATLVFTISNDFAAIRADSAHTTSTSETPGATIGATIDTTTNMGIGLDNIRQRLLLLYGQQASLHITNQQTAGAMHQFVVTLTIPKERNR
jgi:sensor histidine kinase YesM